MMESSKVPGSTRPGCGCARVLRAYHYRSSPSQRLYGNLLQRSALLDGLQKHLRSCGWLSRPAGTPLDFEFDAGVARR